MKNTTLLILLLSMLPATVFCQTAGVFSLVVLNDRQQVVSGATVKVLRDGKVISSLVAGADGKAEAGGLAKGVYRFLVSSAGFQPKTTGEYRLPGAVSDTVRLVPMSRSLQEVTVTGRTPPVERKRDKTIINVEASVTNTGSTVLEVLERSPGVTVDRNGGVSLNGKPGVLVMIDDKPTYLSGDDLNNLLSSMNSAQVARIELIPNPTARYDAAGSAGIINIKTKKNKNNGLNGSLTTSFGQGVYPKTNNSLVLNYRKGRVNTYLNYSINDNKYLNSLYAFRQYYDDNKNVTAVLQQPSYFKGTVLNNTVKAGMDYTVSSSTTIGMGLTGTDIHRNGNNTATANWLRADGQVDSSILTQSRPENRFRNGAINLNGKQVLAKNAELTADVDYLHYQMRLQQDFDNQLQEAGGYEQIYRNNIPTTIEIFSAKADATIGLGGDATLTTGFKSSSSHTDNAATYQNWENQQWVKDETLSNHFVYQENIQAVYGALEGKIRRWSYQGGLRYEYKRATRPNRIRWSRGIMEASFRAAISPISWIR